jgi:CheY-like chemotaxis protein
MEKMEKLFSNSSIYNLRPIISKKKSILVIDDSEDTLDLSRLILDSEGFIVFTARSGKDALNLLTQIEQPNLILLDMQLGDMSGTEFLNRLEEKQPEIINRVPIVFVTGMDELPKTKAVGIIRKPIEVKKLIQLSHHFIETANNCTQQ